MFSPLRPEISAADVTRELDVDRSIASRLLAALEARGYVTQDALTGRFRLGIRTLELGALYLQHDRLVGAAVAHLQALAVQTESIANLFILDGGQVVRLASYPARPMTNIRMPAHCIAAGKVLLAALSDRELDDVVRQHGLPPSTPRSITTPKALRADLACVRERGYASEMEERNLGRACLAAPVRDVTGRIVAAISAAWLASKLAPERRQALIDAVREAALLTSEGLGNGPIVAYEIARRRDAPSGAGILRALDTVGRAANTASAAE